MSQPHPAFFVTHGAPTFALRPGAAGAALSANAIATAIPRAIVIVSAHWDTAVPTVGFANKLETIYDFFGFPEALYQIRYPATGCHAAAEMVTEAIAAAGLPINRDAQRGLDHGAWIPLRVMFPDASVPIVPLSIQTNGGPQQAYQIGLALAPLASKGIMVIGSGSMTHNLRDYHVAARNGGRAPAYVRQFAEWIAEKIETNDLNALLDYRQQAPDAVRAHPTEEHFLPLFVALGAAGNKPKSSRIHAGIDDYVIAMDAYKFTPQSGVQL